MIKSALSRRVLIATALLFLGVFVGLPLAVVFGEAFRGGIGAYIASLRDPDAVAAIGLTLRVAAIAVPLNVIFGIAAAWAISKFSFPGKHLLTSLIDVPVAVSPVMAGMAFVLLCGTHGWLGPWFTAHGIRVIFAEPGMVLATTFVTVPFVARELIPLMQEHGAEAEEAAVTLGASGWQMFRRVTLPSIAWGILYGMVLCNARAMGEFGAVAVVSGHIRGATNTMPLHVEVLYDDYQFQAAFAVASLLTLLALVTLGAKWLLELIARRRMSAIPVRQS